MNIWLVLLLGGLITFAIRFSFIYLFGKFHVPDALRKALHYVPPAVLSAIIFPELFIRNEAVDLSLDNHRLMAGLVATLAAWFTINIFITILAGMIALLLLEFFL